jgi:hypothetical protein
MLLPFTRDCRELAARANPRSPVTGKISGKSAISGTDSDTKNWRRPTPRKKTRQRYYVL